MKPFIEELPKPDMSDALLKQVVAFFQMPNMCIQHDKDEPAPF